jgi:hypothetical protein
MSPVFRRMQFNRGFKNHSHLHYPSLIRAVNSTAKKTLNKSRKRKYHDTIGPFAQGVVCYLNQHSVLRRLLWTLLWHIQSAVRLLRIKLQLPVLAQSKETESRLFNCRFRARPKCMYVCCVGMNTPRFPRL